MASTGRQALKWGALATGVILITTQKATAFFPDFGGPDGDGDADDKIAGYAHGHAVYGGSVLPEASAAIVVALLVIAVTLAAAVTARKRGRSVPHLGTGGGIAAMLALIAVPESWTPFLPVFTALVLLAAAGPGGFWLASKVRRPAGPAPDPVHPVAQWPERAPGAGEQQPRRVFGRR